MGRDGSGRERGGGDRIISRRRCQPHPPIDVTGAPLLAGDRVRVVGVPDLSGMSPAERAESLPVFPRTTGLFGCCQRDRARPLDQAFGG